MKNYYDILRVDRTSKQEDIKKAFRKLALEFHPDKNKDPNAKSIFIEIYEAYEILSDEKKRASYDNLLDNQNTKTFTQDAEKEAEYNRNRETARQTGDRYSKYKFKHFVTDIVDEIYAETIIDSVFHGIGNVFEGAGDLINDFVTDLDDTD